MMHRSSRNRWLLFVIVVIVLVAFGGGILAYYLLTSFGGGMFGFGQATGTATATQTTHAGGTCGVNKSTAGTYSFSWLRVSPDGMIVNEQGCYVPLVGFNTEGLFLGDAGVGNDGVGAIPRRIAWLKQSFQTNISRINFNSQWWNEDVLVPKANMHFRQWLQLVVKWEEQNGNYVELDEGPHFPEPPCGGPITLCPSQDQAVRDYQAHPSPATAQELEANIAPGVQAWTDIAKLYANDPAVLYDAWNEPTSNGLDLPTFFKDMNTLIDTIRVQNPRSLIVVYSHGLDQIMSGSLPNYKQPNLVFDAHIYDGFHGISPATGKQCNEPGKRNWNASNSKFAPAVAFAQSRGQAFIINEWGGCYNSPDYNQQILSFAKAHGVALVYFHAGEVIDKIGANLQMNGNGQLVQEDYAGILGSVSQQ